jgi:hypothetical protein
VAYCAQELLKAAARRQQQQREDGAALVGLWGQCTSLLQAALLTLHLCLALLQLRQHPLEVLPCQHCLGVQFFLQGG